MTDPAKKVVAMLDVSKMATINVTRLDQIRSTWEVAVREHLATVSESDLQAYSDECRHVWSMILNALPQITPQFDNFIPFCCMASGMPLFQQWVNEELAKKRSL